MPPLRFFAQDQSTFGKIWNKVGRLFGYLEGWNNYPLSTEKNMSPNQLWIHGLHRIVGSGSTIDKELWEPQNDVS